MSASAEKPSWAASRPTAWRVIDKILSVEQRSIPIAVTSARARVWAAAKVELKLIRRSHGIGDAPRTVDVGLLIRATLPISVSWRCACSAGGDVDYSNRLADRRRGP